MTDQTPHCTHKITDSGVHIFSAEKSTRQAIDEYLVMLREVFKAHPADETFRLIVDVRKDGMPSFAYAMRKARVVRDEKILPSNLRVAYLYDNEPLFYTLKMFLDAMRWNNERLFLSATASDQDAVDLAERWLLSDLKAHAVDQLRNKVTP
ncbi:MAG: hypothetical protein AAF125_14435 [Chloroflexota bacterium]